MSSQQIRLDLAWLFQFNFSQHAPSRSTHSLLAQIFQICFAYPALVNFGLSCATL